jgi:hypothetical protein
MRGTMLTTPCRMRLVVALAIAAVGLAAPGRADAQPTQATDAPDAGAHGAAVPEPAPPRPPPALFYHGQDEGSESQFGALSVLVNVGYSTAGKASGFQIYSPFDLDYGSSLRELAGDYVHVREIPRGYGSYARWAIQEFVPFMGIASVPNYGLHILGEGMLSRKLTEYNVAQGMSAGWARFAAIATVVAAQQLNELLESKSVPVGDSIADTLVNNTVGILLFSNDRFARLFSNDHLHMYFWPGQPLLDVRDGAIYNNSESYLFRVTLGGWTRAKLNFLGGIPSIGLGISYPIGGEDALGGLIVTQGPLVPEHPYVHGPQLPRFSYVTPTPTTGSVSTADADQIAARFTWDRGGSLLATLEIGLPVRPNVVANIYPGLVRLGPVKLGAYVYADASLRAFGLTLSNLAVMPGVRF